MLRNTIMAPENQRIEKLDDLYPCRQLQILQVSQLFSQWYPSPPAVVIHGLEATCKSTVVQNVLLLNGVPHAIIQSQECITGRHLLERTLAACVDVAEAITGESISRSRYSRCENLAALTAQLQTLLDGLEKVVIVFDGIDHQREAPSTIFPALARLGEIIRNLTVIFIVTFPRQRFLHTAGTPHILFPPYSREEAIQIVSRNPRPIFTEPILSSANYSDQAHEEDKEWLWPRFCAAIWDSLAKNIARDVISFRALAEKLWRPFVASIVDGKYGTRDFSKLMVAKRALFQSEDLLVERTISRPNPTASISSAKHQQHELPYFSKYLLCAAYLASYNPARTDSTFFMRSNDKKRRRKGGAHPGRPAQHRKISRRHLPPTPFPLDRLLAIFHAIVPHSLPQNSDVLTSIASLTSHRLLTRSGTGGDALDPTTARWRVNVGWEYVLAAGRSAGFEIEEYMVA